MANERAIALLTDRVSQAMLEAREMLEESTEKLGRGNLGRVLQDRMAEVESLSAATGRVQEAEFEAEVQRRLANRTYEPRDAETASEARRDVVRPFVDAQEAGQDLAQRINATQELLGDSRLMLQIRGTRSTRRSSMSARSRRSPSPAPRRTSCAPG